LTTLCDKDTEIGIEISFSKYITLLADHLTIQELFNEEHMVHSQYTPISQASKKQSLLSVNPAQFPKFSKRVSLSIAISLVLGGCVVGPNFKSPTAPQLSANSYNAATLPTSTVVTKESGGAGIAQHTNYGQSLPAQWWTLFHSPQLDQLIRSALEQNPSLRGAEASLTQAQENFNATYGSLKYPSLIGQLGATRERAQLYGTTPSMFNLYNASVNISYNLDLFGANKRQLEGLMAQVDYQRFEVEAAYQTLVANVVTTAITEASLRAQLKATREVLGSQQKQLDVINKQLALGGIARSIQLTQSTQLAQTQALISPLEKALELTRNQLAVYVGRLPSEAGLPEFDLDSLQLPAELPVSLPSSLVQQRPDIRASEALMHQANAQVGVATANLYPQINLTGSYGTSRIETSGISASSTLWNLGAGLTQPIFNAGSLNAKRRAAIAAYDLANANYRSTVLNAFKNVADSLRAIDSDAMTLQAQANAESLAKSSLDLTTQQFTIGAISYLNLLDAQRIYQQAHINLVQAQAARFTDTAALFQALGGGWWNQSDSEPTTTKMTVDMKPKSE
jgi:NodT family efflux transporter outer membrane factor (OMF) lipoprotein